MHPQCFDVPIEIEDALKSKMHAVVQAFDGPAMKEVMDAEDEVAKLAQDIRSARQKRDFLQAFAWVLSGMAWALGYRLTGRDVLTATTQPTSSTDGYLLKLATSTSSLAVK